jgi:TldD protein
MEQRHAERLLQAGCERGADFVELFQEETRHTSLSYANNRVETATKVTRYGVGIRLLFGPEVLYTQTSRDDESHVLRLIDAVCAVREPTIGSGARSRRHAIDWRSPDLEPRHPVVLDPRRVGPERRLDVLRRADRAARVVSHRVSQVNARTEDVVSEILVCNSEGLWAADTRTRCRFHVTVTAEGGGEMFEAREAPGAQQGFEFFDELDVEALAHEAAERAVRLVSAGYVTGGQMPVVVGNGFGGVIFHEACGHLLETEGVRHKASVFAARLGEQIAHAEVTAVDDGTLPGSWGSVRMDDEGMPARTTVLIKAGVLQTYLSDRLGAQQTGVPRSGNGRRESYRHAPVSRMCNTYIAAGLHTPAAVIASVDNGLYAKKMGGGSVNPATGEFNFAVEEAYRIRHGRVAELVRGASLIGQGATILPRISMVGDDLAFAAGMCGASSGHVPVTVGQPTIRVDEILVGGR